MLCCLYFFPFLLLSPCTEKYNFLGISIVGQSNERGDGGIYIGSIMKGGAVAADGRIEPGDMLLQVCVRDGAIGGVRAVVGGGNPFVVVLRVWDSNQENERMVFSASTCR